jgi:hypothetical protein
VSFAQTFAIFCVSLFSPQSAQWLAQRTQASAQVLQTASVLKFAGKRLADYLLMINTALV